MFTHFQHMRGSPLLGTQVPILSICLSLQAIFNLFYFGQNVHSGLMDLSDMIYQSEWYRYPCSVQRFVLLMMKRAQKPFYLSAYGVMRCNLENFVRVSKKKETVSSTFIIFLWKIIEFQALHWIYSAYVVLRCFD